MSIPDSECELRVHLAGDQGRACRPFLVAGADVGGAWYHNAYPGARCEVRK